jgi:hypothetical protein
MAFSWSTPEVTQGIPWQETGSGVCVSFGLSPFSYKAIRTQSWSSTLMTLSNLNHLPKAWPLNTTAELSFFSVNNLQWGLNFNTWTLQGTLSNQIQILGATNGCMYCRQESFHLCTLARIDLQNSQDSANAWDGSHTPRQWTGTACFSARTSLPRTVVGNRRGKRSGEGKGWRWMPVVS